MDRANGAMAGHAHSHQTSQGCAGEIRLVRASYSLQTIVFIDKTSAAESFGRQIHWAMMDRNQRMWNITLIWVCTSTGCPSTKYGLYFHVFTASYAARCKALGPLKTSSSLILPSLVITVLRVTTPS